MIAVRRREQLKRLASIQGSKRTSVEHVHGIDALRIGEDVGEVPGALSEALVVVDLSPTVAAILGAIQAARVLGLDQGVDAVGVATGDGNANAPDQRTRQTIAFEVLPGRSAVDGLIEPATRATTLEAPGSTLHLIQGREQQVGIMWIHNQVDRAGVVILEQDFFPRFPAIDATKNAALGIRAISVAQSRDKDNVCVARMNHDASDMLGVFETDVGPGLAPVGTLVHTAPVGD